VARALALAAVLALALAAGAAARPAVENPIAGTAPPLASAPQIAWHGSIAKGLWYAGRLRRGVQLPPEGPDWFTWDPVFKQIPNRGSRRWGTDRLVRTIVRVLGEYRVAHPLAPRVGIGDLSRRHGGPFGREYGGLGHASHQNGLDADIYYPRLDGAERRAFAPRLVDRVAAQELVDRFLAAGAKVIYVGPHVGLHGPRGRVVALVHHDDHLHVRLPLPEPG
jgi:murein endopeptidase